jgi:chemotaxis protein histidine kinase CheA
MKNRSPATMAREARFRRMAMTNGGVAKALGNPAVLEAAERRLNALQDVVAEDLARRMHLLEQSATQGAQATYAHAHDIRGLAGGFGFHVMGELATLTCNYIDALGHNAPIHREVLDVLVAGMRRALASPQDPMLELIAAGAAKAVSKTLAKEGLTVG